MSNHRTRIEEKPKTEWDVSKKQTSEYSKVIDENFDKSYKSRITFLNDVTNKITDSYLFVLIPILLFSLVTIILFYLLSINVLTIENFGVRTTTNEIQSIFFPYLKIITLASLILAFTKFRNSNRIFLLLVWISFLASFFSSWIGNRDFYTITSLIFICLVPVLVGISELRKNLEVNEKYNFITIGIITISVIGIITTGVVGGYWMNWITPNYDVHVNNTYLIALSLPSLIIGISLISLKRPSGVAIMWFAILFLTISNGIEGYYMGMTTGIILLPIIALMFVEWENMRFAYRKPIL